MRHFILISITTLTVLLASTIPASAQSNVSETYDAIIVPGYPFYPDGKMNAIYKMRLHWAFELYSSGKTKNIILSGSAVHSPYVESRIFALYLKEMGVDPDHLFTEEQAEHSLENVYYSMELAEELGFEKVAIATDLFQSGMIQILGAKHNLEADYLPANIGFVISKKWKSFNGSIDHQKAYVEDFVPLKERENRKERLNGTRGFRVYANN